jgi:hypothetical protein
LVKLTLCDDKYFGNTVSREAKLQSSCSQMIILLHKYLNPVIMKENQSV